MSDPIPVRILTDDGFHRTDLTVTSERIGIKRNRIMVEIHIGTHTTIVLESGRALRLINDIADAHDNVYLGRTA